MKGGLAGWFLHCCWDGVCVAGTDRRGTSCLPWLWSGWEGGLVRPVPAGRAPGLGTEHRGHVPRAGGPTAAEPLGVLCAGRGWEPDGRWGGSGCVSRCGLKPLWS